MRTRLSLILCLALSAALISPPARAQIMPGGMNTSASNANEPAARTNLFPTPTLNNCLVGTGTDWASSACGVGSAMTITGSNATSAALDAFATAAGQTGGLKTTDTPTFSTLTLGAGSAITSSGAGGALDTGAFTNLGTFNLSTSGTIATSNTTDATNSSAGGAFTSGGGGAFTKKLFVGTALSVGGAVSDTPGNFAGASGNVLKLQSSTNMGTAAQTIGVSFVQNTNFEIGNIGMAVVNGTTIAMPFSDYSSGTVEAMRIQGHHLLIGTTTDAGQLLQVNGTAAFSGNLTASAAILNTGITTDATHTDATVCEDTTSHQFYYGSGAVGICLGTSSLRFKQNVAPLTAGLDDVMKLKTIQYRYKPGYGTTDRDLFGFAAEQVNTVLPKLVGLDTKGRPNSVDWAGMVPVLVNAIQQQQAEIAALKARLP